MLYLPALARMDKRTKEAKLRMRGLKLRQDRQMRYELQEGAGAELLGIPAEALRQVEIGFHQFVDPNDYKAARLIWRLASKSGRRRQ